MFVPPTEEPALIVTKVGEVSIAIEISRLASPSVITATKPQGASSGLSLLLRRGDSEVALGHGDLLQGLEEFKAFSSRD